MLFLSVFPRCFINMYGNDLIMYPIRDIFSYAMLLYYSLCLSFRMFFREFYFVSATISLLFFNHK